MNLVVDIGNSSIKAAVFRDTPKSDRFRGFRMNDASKSDRVQGDYIHAEEAEWKSALGGLCAGKRIERALICSVSDIPSGLTDYMQSLGAQVKILGPRTPLPFVNDYQSPRTLGADRMAAVAGAMMLWPKENVLVVDVGSCVTYDVLNREGHYLGGNIAPGFRMRLLSMHEHTARLPKVADEDKIPLVGYDTPTAMCAGALRGIGYEIRGFYEELKPTLAGPVRLVLTGGDARLVKERCNLRAAEDDMLVLRGLDYILRYNEDND